MQKLFNYPSFDPVFLDCGAYSIYQQGWYKLIPNVYAQWVLKYLPKFRFITCPDVIGSYQKTMDNSIEFINIMKNNANIDITTLILPFHIRNTSLKRFDLFLQKVEKLGISYIGIGLARSTSSSSEVRFKTIQRYLKLVDRTKIKVHLFGIADANILHYLRPNSTDSTGISLLSGRFRINDYVCEDARLKSKNLSLNRFTSEEKYKYFYDGIIAKFPQLQKLEASLTMDSLKQMIQNGNHIILTRLYNACGILFAEDHLNRNKPKSFSYFTTSFFDNPSLATNRLLGLLYSFYKKHTLLSYAVLINKYSDSLQDRLLDFYGEN